MINAIITGYGAFVPENIVANAAFAEVSFYRDYGQLNPKPAPAIVQKFGEITEIVERRLAEPGLMTSDMAATAAREAIADAGIDAETLDYIIVAHNFGDVSTLDTFADQVPNLAARIKSKVGIKNPNCVGYDILFGCPGWLQALIQASYYIRSGDARRVLVIGADAVSRVADRHDVDSMLFSDGAGAVVLEGRESDQRAGILAHRTLSHCQDELSFLTMGKSFNDELTQAGLYLKMKGRSVFRYSYEQLPGLILGTLERAGLTIDDVKYLLLHQANGKMLRLIAGRLFELAGRGEFDDHMLPMNVQRFGNNSVATIPILLHDIVKGSYNGHALAAGDTVVMSSVGAGMHVNALVYRF